MHAANRLFPRLRVSENIRITACEITLKSRVFSFVQVLKMQFGQAQNKFNDQAPLGVLNW